MRTLTITTFILTILAAYLILNISSKNDEKLKIDISKLIDESMEMAYFEGQRDAIEGDIRIKKVDSSYVWIKSCWDSGKKPIFDPSKK